MSIAPLAAGGRQTPGLPMAEKQPDLRRELQATQQFLAALLCSIRDPLLMLDRTAHIRAANEAAVALLGYSEDELIGLRFDRVLEFPGGASSSEVGALLERLCDLKPEQTYVAKDGTKLPVFLSPTPVTGADGRIEALICTVLATPERRAAEVELRQADKLESVGRLAAGVAHEINTPIQFVGDSVYFLRSAFGDLEVLLSSYRQVYGELQQCGIHDELMAQVSEVEQEADLEYLAKQIPKAFERTIEGVARVTTIVRALKRFAHPPGNDKAAADLNQALRDTLAVARNEYKYVADVHTELAELPPIMCHISDLNQVFLNLIVNAAHAIEDVVVGTGTRGRIEVLSRVEGQTVLVSISDTGGGIPDSIHTRLFEPFFTTKSVGRGTGQGLAVARHIVVDKHGGRLSFDTELGKGTRFVVKLPIDGQRFAEEAA